MNYRHAFHAGNFADVFKHAAIARILSYIEKKDSAFRVLDTHAGRGAYSLEAEPAQRTDEWRDGIGRVLGAPLPPQVSTLLAPWLDLVRSTMSGSPAIYPGSPALVQHLSRAQDRLVFCEKHPVEARELRAALRGDKRTGVIEGDGWEQLKALMPPPERRGLVIIDPPYEEEREFGRVVAALGDALLRWPTGVFLVWYPIKGRREIESFARRLGALPAKRILRAEIGLYQKERVDRLNGCGVAIINPTWHLDEELKMIGECLAPILAREGNGFYRGEWLKFD